MEIRAPGNLGGPREVQPDRKSGRAPSRSRGQGGSGSDRVEISDLARLKGLLANVPPIREEKVRAIREQVRSGSYLTDAKVGQAFDRMFQEETGA